MRLGNRYATIKESTQVTDKGENYPDLMSFPIEKFSFSGNGKEVVLTQSDLDRFDLTCARQYGSSIYGDLVLWLNNISSIHYITAGETIVFPSLRDLEKFMIKNLI
jgi:hypothetical protein